MVDIQFLTTVWYFFELALMALALFVVPRNRKPTSGMAWLMVIFLAPAPGFILFLILGSPKLPKSRRDAQKTLNQYISRALKDVSKEPELKKVINASVSEKYQNVSSLAASLTRLPVFSHNNVVAIDDYYAVFHAIIADIASAKHFVYVEYYILALDDATEPVIEALEQAAARGVTVRVLYDAYGSRKYKRKKEMRARLQAAGVQIHSVLPFRMPGKGYVRPDLRNHRKLVVIDGHVGYTGSQNMVERAYHRKDSIVYDELVTRLTGPVVTQLEAVFITDWFSETGTLPVDSHDMFEPNRLDAKHNVNAQLVPSGPGYDDENNLKVFTAALYDAKDSITIVNPYFVPDESLIMALVSAARRGVEVRMVNSEAIDQFFVAHAQRSYYEQMLQAGVEIFLYKAPTLLHSKYILIDSDLALVGSSNMDIRSFELNQELTLVIYDEAVVSQLRSITTTYLKHSRRINPRKWLARRRYKQLLDNLARLTSSLQ